MRISAKAWHNGALKPLETGAPSVASISLHLGTSVFDGFIAYWNTDHYYFHRAEAHLDRFKLGARRLGLDFSWTAQDIFLGVATLLEEEAPCTQYIRPIAYRKGAELWVTGAEGRPVDVTVFAVPIERDIDREISCQMSPIERISSRSIPGQTKVSGAYVNSHLARRTAELSGFDDGLMLDREGRIAEASAANAFFIRDGRLVTPNLNQDVFPGVTRAMVLEIATSLGIEAAEKDLRPADIEACDGAFVCSTLMELRPIGRLGEQRLGTSDHEIYRSILREFRSLVHQ